MAATATNSLVQHLGKVQSVRTGEGDRIRQISPRAGRALEILGHAIEYLTDEYVRGAKQISANDPEVQAIQLLMRLNREIYFDCPVVPTIANPIRRLFQV